MAIYQVNLRRPNGPELPAWPFAIDWSSPQAQGLEACFVALGGLVVEVVSGRVATLSGAVVERVGPPGLGADLDGSDFFSLSYSDTPFISAAGYTLLWSGIVDVGSVYHHFAGKHIGNGAGSNPFDFRSDNHATLPQLDLVRADAVGNFRQYSSSGSPITIGRYQTYGVRCPDNLMSTAPDFFIDGVKTAGNHTSGSGTTAIAGSVADISLGRRADGAVQLDGLFTHCRLYHCAVPDATIQAASDPRTQWDLFRPIQRHALLNISAGGGGRTTKNTRAFPLGVNVGMGWRMSA